MMKVLAFVPLVSAYQVMDTHDQAIMGVDTHASYDGMKATLKGISAMQQKGDIDADTITTVREILGNITTQLLEALDQDRIHAQSILNTSLNGIKACDNTKNTWAADTWPVNTGLVSTAKSDHETCRNAETVGEQAKCADATSKCNTYNSRVCSWRDSYPNCRKPTGRFENGDTDEMNTYVDCIMGFMTAQKTSYYAERTACLNAFNDWATKTGECDGEQGEYEQQFCDTEKDVETACHTYRTCRNSAQSSYVEVKNQVQELQQIFQAQRVALACLQCYGNKILANTTDLSECEDDTVKCTDFTDCPIVVFDPVPDCLACTQQNRNSPCSDTAPDTDFCKDYDFLDGTCSPPQTCQSCTERHSTFTQLEWDNTCDSVAATAFEQR